MNRPRPATDRTALALAGGMAFLAGATDIYGLSRLGDLFVSFMSGNTTTLGRALGDGAFGRAGEAARLIGLFVLGAAAGAAIAERAGSRRATAVAFTVAAGLAVPLLQPDWTTPALVLSMGGLNAAMSRVGETSVSLTYVTGTLVRFGQGVGQMLCGRPGGGSWVLQGAMWLCLLGGAVCACLLQQRLGPARLWPLPALALAALTAIHDRRST